MMKYRVHEIDATPDELAKKLNEWWSGGGWEVVSVCPTPGKVLFYPHWTIVLKDGDKICE
jgi:hypothetical protein